MRTRLREAGILLLVLGALRITFSIFIFVSSSDATTAAELSALKPFLVIDVLTGLGMISAAPFVEKRPETIVFSVLVGWATAQILVALISTPVFISGLLARLIVAFGLVRCLAAARRAETLRRHLVESASGP